MKLIEMIPQVKTFGVFPTNLANPESQMLIVVNGQQITLSRKLTDLVRSKKVTLPQLGEYTIREVEGKKDKKPFLSLGLMGETEIEKFAWESGTAIVNTISIEEFTKAVAFVEVA